MKKLTANLSQQVSTFEMDEETALMGDKSEEESGEVSESDIDRRQKRDGGDKKEESDEELINL